MLSIRRMKQEGHEEVSFCVYRATEASKQVRPFCSMDREPRHLSRFLWPGNCSENGYSIIDCCGITIEINIEARNNLWHM